MNHDTHNSVGARPLEGCISVSPSTLVADALAQAADWLLVEHDGQLMGVLHRADLEKAPPSDPIRSVVPETPTVVLADAAVPVSDLLASSAVQAVAPAAVVVMEGDKPIGIWSEDVLLETSALGVARYGSDSMLPGQIKIPPIVKCCQFRAIGAICGAVRSFVSRPVEMPACDDPKHVGIHPFSW